MQKFTLRLFVVLATFLIGVSAVIFCFFHRQVDLDTQSANIIKTESKSIVDVSHSITQVDEDYAVYSTILADSRYKNKIIIISDYTLQSAFTPYSLNQDISNLSEDTISNYQTVKEDNQKLENNFAVEDNVLLLSEKERSILFRKGQNGWEKFYKKYSNVKGIISFSRVGFNQERTQALVSVSIGCGSLCGEGNLIFLEKENGKWNVERKIGLWVS